MFRFVAAWALSCSALVGQANPDFSAVGEQIKQTLAAGSVPAMAVAVTQHGRIIWEQGFGLADREKHVEATANTPFYLASITKSLTSTAVLELQQSGKVDLDRPLNNYLGPAKLHSPTWDANQATVRRVATHTAGLTTFYRACNISDPNCKISIELEIARYGILVWPPGERFDYSNLGYAALGEVVAHVSGQTFADFLQTGVFQPLGMQHCSLNRPRDAAANYDQQSHERTPNQISGSPGASAAYCSAHDLALFAMFHLKDHIPAQRHILKDAALDELHRPVTEMRGGQQYAIGWWTDQRGGEPIVFGQGGTTDSFSVMELFPAQNVAIVMLANSWSDDLNMPNAIEKAILAKVLPNLSEQPRPATNSNAPQLHNAAELTGKWSGRINTYNGIVPITITVSKSGDATGHVGSAPDAPLRSLSIRGDHIYAILKADLHEGDAPAPPYDVEFDMFLRGAKLAGGVTTRPGATSNIQLPHWAELEKVPEE
jgi:CubicO group peptidase (beta-lactamase class C family)